MSTHHITCPQCGSTEVYDSSWKRLRCENCGAEYTVKEDGEDEE